jgi:hypothetical protein
MHYSTERKVKNDEKDYSTYNRLIKFGVHHFTLPPFYLYDILPELIDSTLSRFTQDLVQI